MITVNKNEFLNAIRAVKANCEKNNIQPILSTIRIKTIGQSLQLTGTNLSNSAQITIDATVKKDCDFCINADKLENIVFVLGEDITIKCSESIVTIMSGKAHFDIRILSAEEFPELDFSLSEEKIVLEKTAFINGVNKTIVSVVKDNTNILNGICLTVKDNAYEFATTDGNRLCQVKFETEIENEKNQLVIPHTILMNIVKYVEDSVEIYFKKGKVIFKTGNCLYSTKLLQGNFPPYEQLIPTEQPLNAIINRVDLLNALERVAIMSDSKTNIAIFDFKNNELCLTSSCEEGKAEDMIEIVFNGELKIAFNFRFILDGIKSMSSEFISFGMASATSACLITGDFNYLVMPIQTQREK